MNTSLRAPKLLHLTGNVAKDCRRFRQNFEIFLIAVNATKKFEGVKVAILLNCIGEEVVQLFNTFNLNDDQTNNTGSQKSIFSNALSFFR